MNIGKVDGSVMRLQIEIAFLHRILKRTVHIFNLHKGQAIIMKLYFFITILVGAFTYQLMATPALDEYTQVSKRNQLPYVMECRFYNVKI